MLAQGFWNQGFKPGDTPDLRMIPVMGGFTTADVQAAVNVADITDLDVFDGAGVTEYDAANVTVEWVAGEVHILCDEGDFGTPDAGSDTTAGLWVWLHVDGTAANDIAIGFVVTTPANGDGVTLMRLQLPSRTLFVGREG